MDTHQIRLTGTAEVPEALDDSKYILVAGEFEVSDISKKPDQEGGYKYTYKLFPIRLVKVEESGEKIRLKTKSRNSTKIRFAVMQEARKRPTELDETQYYDTFSDRLLGRLPEVLDLLEL
jgi:hypothetical protein